MRIRPLVFGFMCLVIMASCSGKTVSTEQELKNYILDDSNGLYKSISKGDVNIQILYRPSDIVWMQELKNASDDQERNRIRLGYDSLSYFLLNFSRKGEEIESAFVSDPELYKQVIHYLAFDIRDHIFMVQNGDTTRALDVMYTRTFGGSSGTNVIAVFKGNLKKQDTDLNVCFSDDVLGLGSIRFEFKIDDIKKIPTLAFK